MSSKTSSASLANLINEVQKIGREAQSRFGSLSAEQINWKPSAEEWSVGQCFDHLITTNRTYFPMIERVAAGLHKRTLWQRMPILPGLFARLLIGAVSPESKRKLKAPQAFRPAASAIDPEIIKRFALHQEELASLMKATESARPEKLVVPSSASPLVIYSLLDGYRILVTHERRHFQQALRVMESIEFPRN